MLNKKCAICNDNQATAVLYKENFNFKRLNDKTFSARRIPDGTHYQFLKCNNCGLIFSSPILEQNEISKLYSKSSFNYLNESKYLQITYIGYFTKFVVNKHLNKIRILEIGCGNGFFLEELEKLGVKELYGVEPGRASVKKAKKSIKKNIKISMFKNNLFPKKSFDVICCFHTFDHISDPNVFLNEVFSLLKNNGKAFFVVHNTSGLSAKLLGGKSPIFDIEHIYLFNQSNLKRIFALHGFKNTTTFAVKNIYQINYWLKLLPVSFILKKIIFTFLRITHIGKIPISINAGNIGIVAVKEG